MTPPQSYQGSELELFRNARNWKAYVARALDAPLSGRVVEVGAGLGSTTTALCGSQVSEWLCLEPDAGLARRLTELSEESNLPVECRVRCGTTASLAHDEMFDAALYVDVLEHIEDDIGELERIARHIEPAGRIIVLSPAHAWLFSPFDTAIGHFRRYCRADAARLTLAGWTLERADYLDCAGLALSRGNKLLLRRSKPTLCQVLAWDRVAVPVSRSLDPFFGRRVGKSILFVWRRQ